MIIGGSGSCLAARLCWQNERDLSMSGAGLSCNSSSVLQALDAQILTDLTRQATEQGRAELAPAGLGQAGPEVPKRQMTSFHCNLQQFSAFKNT